MPHVGRFRQETLTPPHRTYLPPQQEKLRGQPEQCQGNGLIRQARFIAPPAQHLLTLFPKIWLKNIKELVIKTIHPVWMPPLDKDLFGEILAGEISDEEFQPCQWRKPGSRPHFPLSNSIKEEA